MRLPPRRLGVISRHFSFSKRFLGYVALLGFMGSIIGALLLKNNAGTSAAPNPYWVGITAVWQTGILGGGAYLFLCVWVPYITKFDSLHAVSEQEKLDMKTKLWGIFSKAKHWPDYPIRFMISYTTKAFALLTLLGVLFALIFSIGWKAPISLENIYYDLLFARTTVQPNSAHIMSYLPIPILGLWVAWKFRTGDGTPNSYLGLIVTVLGVVIHEGMWIVGYYVFYGKYLTWALIYNVLGDCFFIVMLYIFYRIYINYPYQKIPIATFKPVIIAFAVFLILWSLAGFHISTVNNFIIGHTQYNTTQWWPDPQTNAWEVGSWDFIYACMWIVIRRIVT